MATLKGRLADMLARKREDDSSLNDRLLAAYNQAKQADDGRRVERKYLQVGTRRRV